MGTVQDPNFWKRFSVAVHQDEAAKEGVAGADLKHSYVVSLSELSPGSIATPTSQTHILPTRPEPLVLASSTSNTRSLAASSQHSPPSPTSPSSPLSPNPKSISSQDQKKKDKKKKPRTSSMPFTRHANGSTMTLGLSGRPNSRFNFWTSVTADPSNRDSWLEGQRRKQRHRTWVCWIFWIALLVVVGGAVATVLVLRHFGIIKI